MEAPPEYRGKIHISLRRETIGNKTYLVIETKDNGIGQSLEDMPEKNWAKYHRVKRLAEGTGGRFKYTVIPGVGATTEVWLPLDKKTE